MMIWVIHIRKTFFLYHLSLSLAMSQLPTLEKTIHTWKNYGAFPPTNPSFIFSFVSRKATMCQSYTGAYQ